jgi:hypothetical protein
VAAVAAAVAADGSGLLARKPLREWGPLRRRSQVSPSCLGLGGARPILLLGVAEKVTARNGSHATNSSTARPKCNVVNFSSRVQPAPQPLPS